MGELEERRSDTHDRWGPIALLLIHRRQTVRPSKACSPSRRETPLAGTSSSRVQIFKAIARKSNYRGEAVLDYAKHSKLHLLFYVTEIGATTMPVACEIIPCNFQISYSSLNRIILNVVYRFSLGAQVWFQAFVHAGHVHFI